jgi:ABC-type branched-subunit amino acid transport system substrate-binding protein
MAKGQACTTELLTSHLQRVQLEGATGTIAFQPDGHRRGQPLLVRIEGAALRVLR